MKDLSKDGGDHWVYATALRKIHTDGSMTYLSVCVKPSRENVAKYGELSAVIKVGE